MISQAWIEEQKTKLKRWSDWSELGIAGRAMLADEVERAERQNAIEIETLTDRTNFVQKVVSAMTTVAPYVEFSKSDLFFFVSAKWPYDGSPTIAAIEFLESLQKQRESK
jgi:hypothetical protein